MAEHRFWITCAEQRYLVALVLNPGHAGVSVDAAGDALEPTARDERIERGRIYVELGDGLVAGNQPVLAFGELEQCVACEWPTSL